MAGTGSSQADHGADSGQKLYAIIRDQLINEIESGEAYPAGALLPSVREITVKWTVSTTTARKALAEVVNAGYARSEGTRGHVSSGSRGADAAEPPTAGASEPTSGLMVRPVQVVPAGGAAAMGPTQIDVRVESAPAEVAHALRLPLGERIIVRRRLTTDDHGMPLQLRTSYLVREFAEGTALALSDKIAAPWPDALCQNADGPIGAESYIASRHPNDVEARLLRLTLTACVLARVDITHNKNSEPIDYTLTIWPGENTRLTIPAATQERAPRR